MKNYLELIAQVLGVLSVAGGALWWVGSQLITRYFDMKRKLEELQNRHVVEAIEMVRSFAAEVSVSLSEFKREVHKEFEQFKKDLQDLQLETREHAVLLRSTQDSLERVYRHFAGIKEEHPKSEVQQIGKEAWLVKGKKDGSK